MSKRIKLKDGEKYHCPFCSVNFKDSDLIVSLKTLYKFDPDGNLYLKAKAYDKINCSNCLNDITMSFVGLLYEQDIK